MSQSSFNQHSDPQDKFVLSPADIRLLNKALNQLVPIPLLQTLYKGRNKIKHLNNEQKIGKSILQLGFIVTYENDYVLLKRRYKRESILNEDSASPKNKSRYSIMTSALSETAPKTETDLLRTFFKKVPDTPLQNIKPHTINFLGLIRNKVKDKKDPSRFTTYYFYVYEIVYKKKPFNKLSQINRRIKSAGRKDNTETFAPGALITEKTAGRIHPNYKADTVAYQLLLKKHQQQKQKTTDDSVAWLEAGNMSSLHEMGDTYFIAHTYPDFHTTVYPLIEKMQQEGVKYWTEETHADSSANWHLTNAKIQEYAKGVIIIETKNIVTNLNVAAEIKLAVSLNRRDRVYQIIRLRTDDYDKDDEVLFYQTLLNAGMTQEDINYYADMTVLHFHETLIASIVERLKD